MSSVYDPPYPIPYNPIAGTTRSNAGVAKVYNVLDYGADPTGVNDSTEAIQAAVVQAQNNGCGGDIWLGVGYRYLVSAPIKITGENIHFRGPGWSVPHPGATNPVSRGTPLSTLTPSASFPADSPVLDFNNTSYMINGCSVEGVSFDGSLHASAVSGVTGIHFGNAAFLRISNIVAYGLTGNGILIDAAGATYANPSTSQIYIDNLNLFTLGSNGIEFAAGLFMTDVYVHDFWMYGLSGVGVFLGQSSGAYQIHVYDGAIYASLQGVYCGTFETYIHDLTIAQSFNNGIEYAQTQSYGYMSHIHHNIIRDSDRNTNGSAGIMVDTGSYDLLLDNNVCEKVNDAPEYGFLSVDGFNDTVHNVYLDRSNYAVGNSVANYKSGSYEVTSSRFSMGPQTAPAVPASGTALTNPFPFDCTVYVNGGTVTAVDVGGTATGQIAGAFPVPAGETITLTYSAAPTWTWFGN